MNRTNYHTFVVVNDDKITSNLFEDFSFKDVLLIKDKSSNVRRVLKLVINRRIPVEAIFKMSMAEFRRKRKSSTNNYEIIKSNQDLLKLYQKFLPSRVVLFRAGLIIKRNLFPDKLIIQNLHCASLPKYGGLASIYRALKDQKYDQNVTLHEVTDRIDEGNVIQQLPYFLPADKGYHYCEDMAYRKGFELLCRTL